MPATALVDASLRYDFGYVAPSRRGAQLAFNISNIADARYVARCSSESACFYGNRRTVIGSLIYRR